MRKLREAIMAGYFEPGVRLVESSLFERLDVSPQLAARSGGSAGDRAADGDHADPLIVGSRHRIMGDLIHGLVARDSARVMFERAGGAA